MGVQACGPHQGSPPGAPSITALGGKQQTHRTTRPHATMCPGHATTHSHCNARRTSHIHCRAGSWSRGGAARRRPLPHRRRASGGRRRHWQRHGLRRAGVGALAQGRPVCRGHRACKQEGRMAGGGEWVETLCNKDGVGLCHPLPPPTIYSPNTFTQYIHRPPVAPPTQPLHGDLVHHPAVVAAAAVAQLPPAQGGAVIPPARGLQEQLHQPPAAAVVGKVVVAAPQDAVVVAAGAASRQHRARAGAGPPHLQHN